MQLHVRLRLLLLHGILATAANPGNCKRALLLHGWCVYVLCKMSVLLLLRNACGPWYGALLSWVRGLLLLVDSDSGQSVLDPDSVCKGKHSSRRLYRRRCGLLTDLGHVLPMCRMPLELLR